MREEFYQNQLFAGIPREVVSGLSLDIKERVFEPREIIFREGDLAESFYLVAEGIVQVSKGSGDESEKISTISPGQYVGEMAVIDRGTRSAAASAIGRCILGEIDTEGFDRIAVCSSEVTRNFVHTLVQRLRATDDQLLSTLLRAERTSTIGKMTGSIVHDLRNPVQNVLTAAEFCAGDDSPEMKHVAKLLEKSANRMMRMLQELLDFSKGRPQLTRSSHSTAELARTLDEEILHRLRNRGINARCDVRYDGEFSADFDRFLRVLINIIRNAQEAMPNGGDITVCIFRGGSDLKIDIADTGKGIPDDSLARIFEPFFSEGKANGTGIGMSMAKSLVESHGGTITVTSKVGVGTTFHLSLPLDGKA